MNFERGIDPKASMDIGIFPKIQSLLPSGYSQDFYSIWSFALEGKKNWIISYMSTFHGKKWMDGKVIDFGGFNNELLWRSITYENAYAVKMVLQYPNLFKKETLKMDQGASELKDEFIVRGEEKRHLMATNFGAFVNLAIEHYPNKEIEFLLCNYFTNETNR